MGKVTEFKKVNLFSGVIFRYPEDLEEVVSKLSEFFSEIDFSSDTFDFTFTDYYFSEMGTPLYRKFLSFSKLISPLKLPDIKNITNEIELVFSNNGKRRINLDPGYLSDANVIIATTKNHYHRIPLSNGIYAHMEYIFKNKKIHFLEWTYPDFRSESYISFFNKLMMIYKGKLKKNSG